MIGTRVDGPALLPPGEVDRALDAVLPTGSPPPVLRPPLASRILRRAFGRPGSLRRIGFGVLAGMLALLWWAPVPAADDPAWRTGILFVGAVAAWAVALVPEYVVALAFVALYNLLRAGATSSSLGGFATPSWFLLVATLGLGAALSRSGLVERIALRLMLLLPATFLGQSIAMLLGGWLVTPVFPLTVARCALAGPLAASVAEGLGYAPRSREAAGLGLAAFVGSGLLSRAFLSGATLNFLAWSLLPAEDRIDWGLWALAALPSTAVVVAGVLVVLCVAYRPKGGGRASREAVEARLAARGPASAAEWWAGSVTMAVLVGFVVGPRLGVEHAWIGCGGVVLLAYQGVLTREHLRSSVDWPLLLFLGVVLGLPGVFSETGLDGEVAGLFQSLAHGIDAPPVVSVLALFGATLAARFVLSEWIGVPLLTIAFLPAAASLHLHPWVVAYVVLVGANLWLLPYQFTSYLAFLSGSEGRLFEHRQVAWASLLYLVLAAIGLAASVPFWRALGLVD